MKPENKRTIGSFSDPGNPEKFEPAKSLDALDPFESAKHPPATHEMDPNDVRQRPYPESHNSGWDAVEIES